MKGLKNSSIRFKKESKNFLFMSYKQHTVCEQRLPLLLRLFYVYSFLFGAYFPQKTQRKEGFFMTLTPKESSLLSDLKSSEQLCIDKYAKGMNEACDPALKDLFSSLQSAEQSHLGTLNRILGGEEPQTMPAPTAMSQTFSSPPASCSQADKEKDALLCKDALAIEKHVSSTYNVSIFEFKSPAVRDALAHIQKEEQNHGQQLYQYLSQNGMYS